jgi:hypothetical protein
MIGADTIIEILSVYKKHGWTLRRVLLSEDLKNSLGESCEDIFEGIRPSASTLDGLWFSRSSKGTLEAWELRHLSANPYALVEVIDSAVEENKREDLLRETQIRMQNSIKRSN